MRWTIFRVVVVGASFLVGMLVAGYQNSSVLAPGTSAADLSSTKGTSLVVTCEAGDPAVEHIIGLSSSVEVKCEKSHMRVTRFGADHAIRSEGVHPPAGPSTPIAAIGRNSPIAERTSSHQFFWNLRAQVFER